ncbi:MAG: ABC transporter ATP-binding protein/permease, partial [Candidatus Dormibacteraeota bacterium]|nr:ABC transporter ATP-binding protein/permease [Candidatus Dormibacteraeota bacterium]
MTRREFTLAGEYAYDRRSPWRWVISHMWRYPGLPALFLLTGLAMAGTESLAAVLVGRAFDTAVSGAGIEALFMAALLVAVTFLVYSASDIINTISSRVLAQRVERDARDEVYLSLLGKSQTFHGRQRVGDLMARVTNDVQQTSQLVSPGLGYIIESILSLVVPLIAIATLRLDLLLVPLLFLVAVAGALRRYNTQLRPVAGALRERFGVLNAGLAEAIAGIEVVKGFAQEGAEGRRFSRDARAYRDAFAREGDVEARALPLLVHGVAVGLAFGHALVLFLHGGLSVGQVITYMALLNNLRSPMDFLLTMFSVVQQSIASARRVLTLIKTETELDENAAGLAQRIAGEITFAGVSFGYDYGLAAPLPDEPGTPAPGGLVLKDISFTARPGETIAIVGQTGAGKTTLSRLVNRTFDPAAGRVYIDGVDVRDWSLASLRSQIATIEQDIVLFSRTIAENIAFGAQGPVTRAEIEAAAQQAQAHEFIMRFPAGYETIVGERGVTLSGGQRQRIAIARAFLTDPRILILDDSTSAIDSNTEDQIQRAMRRILTGRTTLLITHRLAQIRRADRILVLKHGALIAQGSHEELLATSPVYREIFVPVAPEPL